MSEPIATGDSEAALKAAIDALAARPELPAATEIYDALMAVIEPDLKRASRATVEERRPGETEEQHAERLRRYEQALERYAKALETLSFTAKQATKQRGKNLFKAFEGGTKEDEAAALQQIESSFGAA